MESSDTNFLYRWLNLRFLHTAIKIDNNEMSCEILEVPLKIKLVALGKEVNCELHLGFIEVKKTKTYLSKYNVKPVISI